MQTDHLSAAARYPTADPGPPPRRPTRLALAGRAILAATFVAMYLVSVAWCLAMVAALGPICWAWREVAERAARRYGGSGMSMRLQVYVGPYLECRVERAEVVVTDRSCPNPSCTKLNMAASTAFCPGCGTKIEMTDRKAMKPKVYWLDAAGAIKEALQPDNCGSGEFLYWTPNHRRDPPRDFFVREDCAIDFSDNHHDPDEQIWFNRAFAPEIGKLRELYGEANARTAWGVIAYTS